MKSRSINKVPLPSRERIQVRDGVDTNHPSSSAFSLEGRRGRSFEIQVGVDIVEIDRIARSTRNPRFLKRVFTPKEVAYCRSRKNAAQHFAVRFAAKEAVWKAVGDRRLLHRDIQVHNRPDGKPEVRFPARFCARAQDVSISLSHGQTYAVAMAVYHEAR